MKTLQGVIGALLLGHTLSAIADMQEIAPQEMNNSYIPGISIPKVAKGSRCVTPTQKAVSECHVEDELKRSALGKEDSNQSAASLALMPSIPASSQIPSLNAPLYDSVAVPSAGLATQSGQQVQIQIVSPIPIMGNYSSTNVNMSSTPAGATIQINLPR